MIYIVTYFDAFEYSFHYFMRKAHISRLSLNKTDLLDSHVFCKVFMNNMDSHKSQFPELGYLSSSRIEAHSDFFVITNKQIPLLYVEEFTLKSPDE